MPQVEITAKDGRKQVVDFDHLPTPEDIDHAAGSVFGAPTIPELREQPTAFQEATSPEGIASPSNVGSLGGGILGGIGGTMLGGPGAGTYLGAVAGAGVGRGVGRLGEILARRYAAPVPQAGTAPVPPETPTAIQDVGSVGQATQRGMVEQAAGEAGGALLNAGVSRALAPFAARTAANQPLIDEATRLGFTDLPASVQTGSSALAQAEKFAARFPIGGSQPAQEASQRTAQQAQQAVQGVAERVAPGVERDLATVGSILKGSADVREGAAKKAAGEIYDQLGQMVGDTPLGTDHLTAVARAFAKRTQPMAGLASPAARKGASLTNTLEPPPVTIMGQTVDPLTLPQSLLTQLGIDPTKSQPLTFQALRDIQSAAGAASRKAANEREAGYFKRIYQAATEDINAIRETNPRAGQLLDLANAVYKRHVVGVFRGHPGAVGEPANTAILRLEGRDASKVIESLMAKNVSPETVAAAREAVGPDAWKQAGAAWLEDLATRRALDPQTGQFSVNRFLTAVSPQNVRPESLVEVFGNLRARDFRGLLDVLQHVQRSGAAAANPSETGRSLLGAAQIFGVVHIATALATGDVNRAAKEGVAVLTPALLARVLFSPGGIRWLTKGITVQPGTQEAMRIASQIVARAGGTATQPATLNDVLKRAPGSTP